MWRAIPRSWIRSNSMPSMSELVISSWSVHSRSSRRARGVGAGVCQGTHLVLRAGRVGTPCSDAFGLKTYRLTAYRRLVTRERMAVLCRGSND